MPPEAIVYALALGIIIVSVGTAVSLIVLALRFRNKKVQQPTKKEIADEVIRSFNRDLEALRSQRFGRRMSGLARQPANPDPVIKRNA